MPFEDSEMHTPPVAAQLGSRIRRCCLQRGWDAGELARRAGVSRTTLYHLQRGTIRSPRPSTLQRIARALEIAPEELAGVGRASAAHRSSGRIADTGDRRREFDRATNTMVTGVYDESPGLFLDWTAEEWDELYSTFGTGGQLARHGVVEAANRINRKRETQQQLHVLLETHLSDVAVRLVDTLYRMVCAEANLAPTAELSALLASHHAAEKTSDNASDT